LLFLIYFLDCVRTRALSAVGEPAIAIYDNALDLGESYSVTLMVSIDATNPVVMDIRKNSNTQWNFVGFVFSCIQKGYLKRGDTLVCDNASVHRGQDSEEALNAMLQLAGVRIKFLPTYSPELNPCELVFGYVKRHLREYRRGGNFQGLIKRLFRSVPVELMFKWYRHCLYPNLCEDDENE
jgi:hypothetical protein